MAAPGADSKLALGAGWLMKLAPGAGIAELAPGRSSKSKTRARRGELIAALQTGTRCGIHPRICINHSYASNASS